VRLPRYGHGGTFTSVQPDVSCAISDLYISLIPAGVQSQMPNLAALKFLQMCLGSASPSSTCLCQFRERPNFTA